MPTVSSNNLQVGVFLLNVFYHIDLEDRVPLRGILQHKENSLQLEFLQKIANTAWEEPQILTLLIQVSASWLRWQNDSQIEHRTKGETAAKTTMHLPCAGQFLIKTSVISFMFKPRGLYRTQEAAHLLWLRTVWLHHQPCHKLQVK